MTAIVMEFPTLDHSRSMIVSLTPLWFMLLPKIGYNLHCKILLLLKNALYNKLSGKVPRGK